MARTYTHLLFFKIPATIGIWLMFENFHALYTFLVCRLYRHRAIVKAAAKGISASSKVILKAIWLFVNYATNGKKCIYGCFLVIVTHCTEPKFLFMLWAKLFPFFPHQLKVLFFLSFLGACASRGGWTLERPNQCKSECETQAHGRGPLEHAVEWTQR